MIYGHLKNRDSYGFLLNQPAWSAAFSWLERLEADSAPGKTPIWGNDLFGVVMEYETVAPQESRFETHRQYVDLQFTIRGAEAIAWRRAEDLQQDGDYDPERDLQFYHGSAGMGLVEMRPGCFSVYYPSDAHLPKLRVAGADSVFKAVVKIGRHLIQ